MSRKLTKSSGNIFRDLEYGNEEAENLRIRAILMMEIEKFIKKEGLTQAQAAECFGVSQPRINEIVKGKINLFTVDKLINLLVHVGQKIEIRVHKAA